jgi:hypothetical protein
MYTDLRAISRKGIGEYAVHAVGLRSEKSASLFVCVCVQERLCKNDSVTMVDPPIIRATPNCACSREKYVEAVAVNHPLTLITTHASSKAA